ncbi:hypothetical protein [Hymenobacter fodinae]|uniref:Uncharacterized protein n=1 Tax=Hymenobacter fodinae TaxID=2510796 RepID=A0A4Z0P1J8_9BACT|nr:hypothetical protein [Hymenobacter fodinae]TGE04913.1 hypothetical protein EU556_22340 [Hymenobacter fodinae]
MSLRILMCRWLVVVTFLLLGIPGVSFYLPAAFSQTAHQIETQTIQQGLAHRQPGEADTTFLKRVLPVSFPALGDDLVAYAWRPSVFGKQLFFSVPGGADNEYGCDLFVLDPFKANTYAVQIIPLMSSMPDRNYLTSLFFADVDQNGQKELLALLECSYINTHIEVDGQRLYGRESHYRTVVFNYVGQNSSGYPQYKEDLTPRPYLDELATAAEVRENLPRRTAPQRKPAAKARK